jgi:hypothetical protein
MGDKERPHSSADRETVAKIIYDAFPFEPRHGMAQKPEWLPGGNSNRQDEARRAADLILALNEPQTLSNREEREEDAALWVKLTDIAARNSISLLADDIETMQDAADLLQLMGSENRRFVDRCIDTLRRHRAAGAGGFDPGDNSNICLEQEEDV